MKLISKIEIAYFRSIYKETIVDVGDLSIFFGRNDSGKSNVLRALNLFFSGSTNPNEIYSIERDLCSSRLAEANERSSNVRKFSYVKIWFKPPVNWKKSLGEEFWVKKQWSTTRQMEPQISSSIESKNQQFLTRFLNKIGFVYIPAIKDRGIFEKLQANIYSVLSNQEQFSKSLEEFSKSLRERTQELSESVEKIVGVQSVIAPPRNLVALFHSLNFETLESGDKYSLTLQRGDGVQVKHIPEILRFINDNDSNDYHIWAFEEPENSLELANAMSESDRFLEFSRFPNKQVFVTSHSPAFFSRDEDICSRFYVSRESEANGKKISKITKINQDESNLSALMGESPHLKAISFYLRESAQKIADRSATILSLEQIISESSRPILFVEGESDKIVIAAAWSAYSNKNCPFEIQSCGGTTKMEALSKDGKVLEIVGQRKIFVLVDNDKEGRALNNTNRLKNPKWCQHSSNKVFWRRLSVTNEFSEIMKSFGLKESDYPFSLENIFSPDIRRKAENDKAYQLSNIPHSELTFENIYFKNIHHKVDDKSKYYVFSTHEDYKIKFAEWVAEKSKSDISIVEYFFPILKEMDAIINDDSA